MSSSVYPSTPPWDMLNDRRYLANPTTLSLTTSHTTNATALTVGMYEVYASVEWYFLQGASDVAATTASILVEPFEKWELYSTGNVNEDAYISGIVASGTGTAYIVRAS